MKQLTMLKATLFLMFITIFHTLAMAQDNTGTTTTTTTKSTPTGSVKTTTEEWYVQPWVWIVGGAVLLIILVALLRPRNTDRVTVTKTIKKDD